MDWAKEGVLQVSKVIFGHSQRVKSSILVSEIWSRNCGLTCSTAMFTIWPLANWLVGSPRCYQITSPPRTVGSIHHVHKTSWAPALWQAFETDIIEMWQVALNVISHTFGDSCIEDLPTSPSILQILPLCRAAPYSPNMVSCSPLWTLVHSA